MLAGTFLSRRPRRPPGQTPGATLVQSFTVTNTDAGAASPCCVQHGFPFKKGDVPAGKVPRVRAQGGAEAAWQWDARSTWSDGSLRFAVLTLRDGDLAAGSSRTYAIESVSGSYDNTPALGLADVTNNRDFGVDFSNRTEATSGSALGAASAAFNTHSQTATRLTEVQKGPVCSSWLCWGMAGTDRHLKVYHHVRVWSDGTPGGIAGWEYLPVVSLDWWTDTPFAAVGDATRQTKDQQNYNATVRDGTTTLTSYTGLQHYYRGQWAGCRTADDHGHGRPHWIAGSKGRPTLHVTYDRAYWIGTGLVPPIDLTVTAGAKSFVATYAPFSAFSHRKDIDGTAGYEGRGLITNQDCYAFLEQTAARNREMRVNAFAGLHAPYHYRSCRTRQRQGIDAQADVSSTPIALRMDPKPAAEYDFTADGMPAAAHAYWRPDVSSATYRDGHVAPVGGTGGWTNGTNDNSHAVNYSTFAYLIEGERYWLECLHDIAGKAATYQVYNAAGANPFLWDRASGTQYWAIQLSHDPALFAQRNARKRGWGVLLLGCAGFIGPDDDPASRYFRKLYRHHGDYIAASLVTVDPRKVALGFEVHHDVAPTPFYPCTNGMCYYFTSEIAENADFRALADISANWYTDLWANAPRLTGEYKIILRRDTADHLNPETNYFSAPSQCAAFIDGVTVSAGGQTCTLPAGHMLQENDVVWPQRFDSNAVARTVPPELVVRTPYYVRQVSANTCKLSTTASDAGIITFAGAATMAWGVQSAWRMAAGDPGWLAGDFFANGDTFKHIHFAALVMAHNAGKAGASAALVDQVRGWIAPHVPTPTHLPWQLAKRST